MKNTNKKGFTLIELMVVVIIVAILAAVALPLMSGNRRKAMSSEALAGAGTVLTNIRLLRAENDGALPSSVTSPMAASDLEGISATDLDGTYFSTVNFVITTDADGVIVTATGTATSGGNGSTDSKYYGKSAGVTVSLDEQGNDTFSYTAPTT